MVRYDWAMFVCLPQTVFVSDQEDVEWYSLTVDDVCVFVQNGMKWYGLTLGAVCVPQTMFVCLSRTRMWSGTV